MKRPMTLREAFENRLVRRDEKECWELESLAQPGYSQFTFQRKRMMAHRVSYELYVGPIPGGYVVDHTCRNPMCVNPAHLEAVTQSENALRNPKNRRAREVCLRGHPQTPENIYTLKGRRQRCRVCDREKYRERNPGGYLDPNRKRATHCPHGHEYNEENTHWVGPERQYRRCRACDREFGKGPRPR